MALLSTRSNVTGKKRWPYDHPASTNTTSIKATELETSMKALARFAKDEAAATAIEYGLFASLISVAIIVSLAGVGASLNATYSLIANAVK